ncbi:MAG TPA: prenyltransferase/squalene oxidase repeat-containing protein [Puia sp.]
MAFKKILTLALLIGWVATSALLISWTRTTDPNPLTADIKKAVSKSLPLLQKSGHKFIMTSRDHCVSCHSNLLTSVLEEKMIQKGLPAADEFLPERRQTAARDLTVVTNINTPDNFISAKFIEPYLLMGFHADKGQPNPYTDIAVDYLLDQQRPDGTFKVEGGRPPHETGEAHLAAFCIHAIQLYTSPAKKARIDRAVERTKQWLLDYQPQDQQELVFQLLGLHWTGAAKPDLEKVAARLKALQNADGSWSQLPSMHGDAYATGEALYALGESGVTNPEDLSIQKSAAWLLGTQDPTGAWIVETRAYPLQPFFNSDFPPYDENQFISAAATNWACLALLSTIPDDPKAISP